MNNFGKMLFDQTVLWGQKIIISMIVLLFFWVLATVSSRAIKKIFGSLQLDTRITSLLAISAKISLIIIGAVTTFAILGINISALLAGLGLTGFALGFALKDTISNLLAGVLLILNHPFATGDRIKVSNYEGIVVSIDLRYTELEDKGNRILIPNSKLFTDPIIVLDQNKSSK